MLYTLIIFILTKDTFLGRNRGLVAGGCLTPTVPEINKMFINNVQLKQNLFKNAVFDILVRQRKLRYVLIKISL